MLFISDEACRIREQTRDNDPDKISVRELLLAETSQSSPYPSTRHGFRANGAILQQLLSLAEPDNTSEVRVSFPRAPEKRPDITLCYRYHSRSGEPTVQNLCRLQWFSPRRLSASLRSGHKPLLGSIMARRGIS